MTYYLQLNLFVLLFQVKEAKKSQAKDKRELEKIRRDINLEVSSKLLPTASKTSNLDTSKDTSYADKLDLGVSKVSNTLDTVSNKKLDHVISKVHLMFSQNILNDFK